MFRTHATGSTSMGEAPVETKTPASRVPAPGLSGGKSAESLVPHICMCVYIYIYK